MDFQQTVTLLKDFGLPAAISAILTVVVKALSDARQRRSKESLLEWLALAPSQDPFKGDERALRALLELQQSLIFERAFGLKAESELRNELLQFAESHRQSMRFVEVLDAGRLVTRLSLARLQSLRQVKGFRMFSRFSKPAGYLYIGTGYIIIIGSMYLSDTLEWTARLEWASIAVGIIFGALAVASGMYMLKQGRRFEIAAAFLGWRLGTHQSSVAAQSKLVGNETSNAA